LQDKDALVSGDIDFHRDLRKDDRFTLVYELRTLAGRPVRSGRLLAAEFVTIYPAKGAGRIHSTECQRRPANLGLPTTAPAVKMGRAAIAKCCNSHEGRLLNLIERHSQ
jgi:hypothetical protein